MSEHWHGVTVFPPNSLGVVQPQITPETYWTRAHAKREMAAAIRIGQGRMRYNTPDGRVVEPADWWLEHDPLEYIPIADGAGMVAVMRCHGNCQQTAVAFIQDWLEGVAAAGTPIAMQTSETDVEKLIEFIAPTSVPGKKYPTPLPEELVRWYCWLPDSGHSIIVVPETLLPAAPVPADLAEVSVPAPVKMVRRLGYRQVQGFLVSPVPYDDELGLVAEDEDEEW